MKKILGIILGILLILGGIGSAEAENRTYLLQMGGPNWSGILTDIIPGTDDTYDLGSASFNWQDLFLSGNITVDDDSWIGLGSGAGRISFNDAATDQILLTGADVLIDALSKLYLDGGGNTYIYELSADVLSQFIGGVEGQRITETSREIEADATVCQDDSGLEIKTVAAHAVSIGSVVDFAAGAGTLCTGIVSGTDYYVIAVDDTTSFQISATRGGSIVAYTDTGTAFTSNELGIIITAGYGTAQTLFPLSDDAVTPTIGLGDGGDGIYSSTNGRLDFALDTALEFSATSAGIFGTGGNHPMLRLVNGSSIQPNLVPSLSDVNTGRGRAGDDALSDIAGGVEAQRLTEAARTIESNASVCQDNSGIELKTVADHGLGVDDVVQVAAGTGSLCTGLSATTNYYVLAVGSNTTATLSASRGGSIVAYTDTGTAFTSYEMEITVNIYGDLALIGLIQSSTTAGITASTTQTQGEGALTSQVNEVSTVVNDDDTVTLPPAVAGLMIEIINNGAKTLQIFPASGDNLGAGVDTGAELEINESVEYVAYDGTNWRKEATTEIVHAEAQDEDNTDVFTVNDAGADFHSYHSNAFVAGDLAGWTFDTGGAGTSHAISGVADGTPSGTDILVTTGDAHGLAVGDIISQTNLADAAYVGIFVVNDIGSSTTYEVTASYTATGTGTMDQAATLIANTGSAGSYFISWYASATSATNNETFDFDLCVNAGTTFAKVRRKFGTAADFGSFSGGGVVDIADGDKISLALSNEDTAGNITIRNLTIVAIRL